ncbi:MAG: AAA family ATPase [Campylobacterota bacterium]|nr:AAA family ATPase [Campylobacterota bacterium]
MLKLSVKNFGVLQDIDIELNKTNLFIGDNGSGKSTLAKLITVITDFTLDENGIVERLKDFNINFLNEDCFIELKEDDKLIIRIINDIITISELSKHIKKVEKEINKIISIDDFIIEQEKNNSLKSKYIPAERNLISLFNQSLSNMITSNIPLPKTILEFSADYNKARNDIKELNILGMRYENENSQDRIYYEGSDFLGLEHSSSGIQSALPLYLTLKYFASKHENIIIEEPELNLYPKSQIDTVKYMIENQQNSSLSIMTHSPYILSVLNILLFAYKASNTNDILKDKISKIIPKEQQINTDNFSAYLIENGISKSIKGKSTGMIEENDIGDMISNEFGELMEIYREFKNDK